jgi:hypothetical protein
MFYGTHKHSVKSVDRVVGLFEKDFICMFVYTLLQRHLKSFVFFVCGLGVSITSLLYLMLFCGGNFFQYFNVQIHRSKSWMSPTNRLSITASVKIMRKWCFICCLLPRATSYTHFTYSSTHSNILNSTLKLQFLRRRISISKTDWLKMCKKMTQRVCGGSYIDQHMSRTAVSSTHSPSHAVICREFFSGIKEAETRSR